MTNTYLSKLIKDEVKSIMNSYGKRLILVGFLIGFLLFLLNVFLGISLYTSHFSESLKNKLGIYFYIKEIPGEENITYKKIITLKEELEQQGLRVEFSSKEDAFKFLEKRVPELISNLEKFNIENPLPATLYVMFKSDKQYEELKKSIIKHKDIILNIKDIDENNSVKQQENRTLYIINLTNFISILSYTLIIVLGSIIISFLLFLINNIFSSFSTDLSIKKFLGAASNQIKGSFMIILLIVIGIAFGVNIILLGISGYSIGFYLNKLFEISLLNYTKINIFYILITMLLELTIIIFISFYSSSLLIRKLNKRLK